MTSTDTKRAGDRDEARITVDVPREDYRGLKILAALSGPGVTMSSILRGVIHDFLETSEEAADIALAQERFARKRPTISDAEASQRLKAARRK